MEKLLELSLSEETPSGKVLSFRWDAPNLEYRYQLNIGWSTHETKIPARFWRFLQWLFQVLNHHGPAVVMIFNFHDPWEPPKVQSKGYTEHSSKTLIFHSRSSLPALSWKCTWHWGLTRSVATLAALHGIKLAYWKVTWHAAMKSTYILSMYLTNVILHIDANAFQTNMI